MECLAALYQDETVCHFGACKLTDRILIDRIERDITGNNEAAAHDRPGLSIDPCQETSHLIIPTLVLKSEWS